MDFNILIIDSRTNIIELDNFKQTASPKTTKVLGKLGEQVKIASELKLDNFK